MKYGSLRKYKKVLREAGDFKNPSEKEFERQAILQGITFFRKGYPDYLILKDGEIIGFVEVKPSKTSKLRPTQERFARFCRKYNIPFLKWSPEDGDIMPFTA